MNFLPQMSSKDLNQRDFKGWNLPMHIDTSQVELDLKADINVGSVYCGGPPECESPIRDLVQAGALGVCEFFVFH